MNYDSFLRNDVLCIDMRSFYASVECVKRGLNPMETMLAVVGDKKRSGSIILAASPELKKRHGVKNVSRYFELPNDPAIHVVEAKMGDYLKVSVEITKLVNQYVPKEAIHQYSVDELWVTVNGLKKIYGNRWNVAQLIKEELYDTMGLNCSIGIGDNKFLAKVVMDLYAKKNGIAECTYEDVAEKLWPIPVEEIWGIGKRMMYNLNRMGIVNLGQLANYSLARLKKRFGIIGEQLYWHAWGVDLSPVIGDFQKQTQKGFGHGITLLRDYHGDEVHASILDLTEEVCRRARTAGKSGRTIHLGIGYSQESGGGFSRSKSVDLPTNITMDVYHVCMQLFNTFYNRQSKVRKVFVTLDHLYNDEETQLNLFEDRTKKQDVGYVMDQIRNQYGPTSILRATSFTDIGVTLDRSQKIGGHKA
ncbi:DinB/UmuC family translesion DNA polymerase [Aquibacillus saliphilus]|uniref:Y-family DNA polymerase n=1 Tax=Aquibacillus saliphilus TaxID=1909422 RepID=UPI001CF0D3A6|nr:UV damage repair protein UvrX [Aquibacillus saliphilus]